MNGRNGGPIRNALDIPDGTVAMIIRLARLQPSTGPCAGEVPAGGPRAHDVDAARLRSAIARLSDDEQAVLLALASIGQEEFAPSQFDAALVAAFQLRARLFVDHLAGRPLLGDTLERGAIACGADLQALGRFPGLPQPRE